MRLSKKHGVGAVIPLCYFCGKEKNEVALLGAGADKVEKELGSMPSRVVIDYEPCDNCKKLGIAILVAVKQDPKQMSRYRCVVQEESVKALLKNYPEKLSEVLRRRVMIMTYETAEATGLLNAL